MNCPVSVYLYMHSVTNSPVSIYKHSVTKLPVFLYTFCCKLSRSYMQALWYLYVFCCRLFSIYMHSVTSCPVCICILLQAFQYLYAFCCKSSVSKYAFCYKLFCSINIFCLRIRVSSETKSWTILLQSGAALYHWPLCWKGWSVTQLCIGIDRVHKLKTFFLSIIINYEWSRCFEWQQKTLIIILSVTLSHATCASHGSPWRHILQLSCFTVCKMCLG